MSFQMSKGKIDIQYLAPANGSHDERRELFTALRYRRGIYLILRDSVEKFIPCDRILKLAIRIAAEQETLVYLS